MAGVHQPGWKAISGSTLRIWRRYASGSIPFNPAGADQPVQQCSTLAAVIAAEEHKDDMTFIYSLYSIGGIFQREVIMHSENIALTSGLDVHKETLAVAIAANGLRSSLLWYD